MKKVLLFVPMYNCEKQIVRVIDQLKGNIKKYISEVIIVNNRSTDNGEEVVLNKLKGEEFEFPIKLLRNDENYGLGGSHKVAFDYAIENGFDYLIVFHGDDQGRIKDIIPVLKNSKIMEKYDSFLGSRFMKGSCLQGYAKYRIIGNYVYNTFYSILLGKKIKDMGSGLNMYKVDFLKSEFYRKYNDGLTFNHCMLLANDYFDYKYIYFPIHWSETDQVSNVKFFKMAFDMFKVVFFYRVKNKQKYMNGDFREKKFSKYSYQIIS